MAEKLINTPTPDRDYSAFFLDSEISAKYPNVKLPPATFVAHEGKIL